MRTITTTTPPIIAVAVEKESLPVNLSAVSLVVFILLVSVLDVELELVGGVVACCQFLLKHWLAASVGIVLNKAKFC